MQDIGNIYNEVTNWLSSFPNEFVEDETLGMDEKIFSETVKEFTNRLKDNYPFHHPLYIGQMLKPPARGAIMAYLAAMAINPNNHALDGGPATARMEKEVVDEFAGMYGFKEYLGHLTTSGTIANFEALLIARETHPDGAIAFSEDAHYTHSRVCNWLRVPAIQILSDQYGKMDLNNLEDELKKGHIKTVVATLSTTSLGANDNIEEILKLKEKYGFRLHVDSAYGGYFKLISEEYPRLAVYDLIKFADSITFDPHKQGLQPYGCGCVIFSDPKVGKYYKHDSPYTYFTSEELHLGEISVECSRAGAAAAALWFTNKLYPLEQNQGLGAILSKTIKITQRLKEKIKNSNKFKIYIEPETNILTYFPIKSSTSEISDLSTRILKDGIAKNSLWVATLKVPSGKFRQNHPDIIIDSNEVIILRSCIIKPFQEIWIDEIMNKLTELSA